MIVTMKHTGNLFMKVLDRYEVKSYIKTKQKLTLVNIRKCNKIYTHSV